MQIPKTLQSLDLEKYKQQIMGWLKLGQKKGESSVRISCDYGKSKIVFLEAEVSDANVKILKFLKAPRIQDASKESEALRELFVSGGFATSKVRISVKGQGVIVRFASFPHMKLEDLKSSISFEIDQYIPFKAHEVVWDCQIIEENAGTGNKNMNVLLVAVKRDDLTGVLKVFQDAGLEIELVDIDALAALNSLGYFHKAECETSCSFLDIGTEISTISIVQHGKPQFIRDVSFGGLDILKRLKRKLGLSNEEALQQIEVDRQPTPEVGVILEEALGDLVSDLKMSYNYYLDQVPNAEPVKSLFVGGGGGYHPIVLKTLSKSLGFSVETMDLVSKVALGPEIDPTLIETNKGLLPVAMGLALRNL